MSATNNCSFLGRLAADVNAVKTAGGKPVAGGRIAVSKGKDKEPLWLNVDVWGPAAERFATAKKGEQVVVTGRIDLETYSDKEGKERSSLKLNADSFAFVGPRKDAPANAAGAEDDDTPY